MTVQISGTQGYIADFSNATVSSRQAFQTSTTNGTTGIYALPNGTSTAASWQATNAADPTNASKILIATNGSTDVQLVSGRNGTGTYLPLTFYTNGSEQMRLDTSGNLGLGVTPSAWSSFAKTLEINGVGALSAYNQSSFQQTFLTTNAYYNTSQSWTYKNSNYPLIYEQNGYSGQHQWYNAASGTAGNAITFTQAMTLDASGQLQLGTTSNFLSLNRELSMNAASGTVGVSMGVGGTLQSLFYSNTSATYLGTNSATPLILQTGGSERARCSQWRQSSERSD